VRDSRRLQRFHGDTLPFRRLTAGKDSSPDAHRSVRRRDPPARSFPGRIRPGRGASPISEVIVLRSQRRNTHLSLAKRRPAREVRIPNRGAASSRWCGLSTTPKRIPGRVGSRLRSDLQVRSRLVVERELGKFRATAPEGSKRWVAGGGRASFLIFFKLLLAIHPPPPPPSPLFPAP